MWGTIWQIIAELDSRGCYIRVLKVKAHTQDLDIVPLRHQQGNNQADIEAKKAWMLDDNNQSFTFNLPDRAGFILPRKREGFIIGFPNFIAISDKNFSSFEKICEVEITNNQTRINDAKVDPYGGIVFGTYNEDPDKAKRKPIANLYRLAPNLSLTHLLSNITVSNGIAFSENENIMYFADTPTCRIQKFEYTKNFNKF